MGSELAACPVCGETPVACPHCYVMPLDAYNTLARRAEIGALVERIVAAEKGLLTIGRTPCRDGSQIYSAWSSRPVGEALSLLDALRALAAELEELTDGN